MNFRFLIVGEKKGKKYYLNKIITDTKELPITHTFSKKSTIEKRNLELKKKRRNSTKKTSSSKGGGD